VTPPALRAWIMFVRLKNRQSVAHRHGDARIGPQEHLPEFHFLTIKTGNTTIAHFEPRLAFLPHEPDGQLPSHESRIAMKLDKRVLLIYALPVAIVYVIWATWMTQTGNWGLFADRWHMTLTMVFGSFIAGSSPEGGGAVAYPVMTLGFAIPPDVARDFSLAIQSVGMTSATLWIIARRVKIETTYLWLALAGGAVGMVIGTLFLIEHVQPAVAKMTFVSFWLSFGIALFVINHVRKRQTVEQLDALDTSQKLELLIVGFIGGMLSSIYGNGIDIFTFAYVTLKYNLSEKVGTPTSVILMASMAVLGNFMQFFVTRDIAMETIQYWVVCIPVVAIFAPIGSYVISRINRLWIAYLVYMIILVQFVAALLIIKPSAWLLTVSGLVFVLGMAIFFVLTRIGEARTRQREASSGA